MGRDTLQPAPRRRIDGITRATQLEVKPRIADRTERLARSDFFAQPDLYRGKSGIHFEQARIHVFDSHTGANLRTLSKHVFGMSHSELADDGTYVWQSSIDGLIYAAEERGNRVLPAVGEFLGLDLAGRALIFQRPPLVRPHEVGVLMPPVKGQLGDYRCRLIRMVDPYSPVMSAGDEMPQPK